MNLFNKLFETKEEPKQEWTIQNNGWEHNAEKYDEFHKYFARAMMGDVE